MSTLLSLFISPANAQTVGTAAASGNVIMQFLPFFLILGVFYFLLIRPQQKKMQEQETMLKALKKGDSVITTGGIVATIAKVESDEYLLIEIAHGVQIKILRSGVTALTPVEDSSTAKNDNAKA